LVNPLPILAINLIPDTICSNAAVLPISGLPAGGFFTGNGIINSSGNYSINPAILGSGGFYHFNYSFTNQIGCTNIIYDSFFLAIPTPASISNLPSTICLNSMPIQLQATPSGGLFIGAGIIGNYFYPAIAGVGQNLITYTYTDSRNCTNTIADTVFVNSLPVLNITTPPPTICVNALPLSLTGVPSGGYFYGTGIQNNQFIPSQAGIGGPDTFHYVYTDLNGCTDTTDANITVLGIPNVNINLLPDSLCINANALPLTGSPVGGVFSGLGVIQSGTAYSFNPILTGPGGPFSVNYSIANAAGCSSVFTDSIYVWNLTPASITNLPNATCLNNLPIQLQATPAGGVFIGAGMIGNYFHPAVAGIGQHIVTYSFMDIHNCTNTIADTILVNSLPIISITTPPPTICVNALPLSLIGTPAGGYFYGTGIQNNQFIPTQAGIGGPDTFHYVYTDLNGCTDTTYGQVTVLGIPNVNINILPDSICVNATALTLTGNPIGGTFSGLGVIQSGGVYLFNPLLTGAGGPFKITYTIANIAGCGSSMVDSIYVWNLTPASINNLPSSICLNNLPIQLQASPTGGVFNGAGMIGNLFYPAVAGAGQHVITYAFTDSHNCTNLIADTIQVNSLPVMGLNVTPSTICVNALPLNLIGTPVGGYFYGTGIQNTQFIPSQAGVGGPDTFHYLFTDLNGCTDTTYGQVTVLGVPNVNINPLPDTICVNATLLTLTGNPIGGVFTGIGVIQSSGTYLFDPMLSGAGGPFVLTYTVTNVAGCSGIKTDSINVWNLTPASITNLPSKICLTNLPFQLLATPTGGLFNGPGIIGNYFYPAVAGAGQHVITYSYTDAHNCTNMVVDTVLVNSMPAISINTSVPPSICANASPIVLSATPTGGYFHGSGITNNNFNPNAAIIGIPDTIYYVYTNNNGCVDSAYLVTNVRPMAIAYASVAPLVGCAPLKITTLNTSINTTLYSWDFGDGTTSNLPNPSHIYPTPNYYQIVYIANNTYGCKDTLNFTVLVNPSPTASFVLPTAFSCKIPLTITTNNTSIFNNINEWHFNNGVDYSIQPLITIVDTGSIPVELIVTNNLGCKDTAINYFNSYPTPIANLSISPASGCVPLVSNLINNSSYANYFVWSLNGTPYSFDKDSILNLYATGTYSISLHAENYNHLCSDDTTLNSAIVVYPNPIADFSFIGTTSVATNSQVIFNNLSTGYIRSIWDFGDGSIDTSRNPIHLYADMGTYVVTLIVISNEGCADTISKEILVKFDHGLFVPDAFMPASNNINSVKYFLPKGIGIKEYHLYIYDTWGTKVFESTKLDALGRPNEEWDGTYKGVLLTQDVYVWKIFAIFKDNEIWVGNSINNSEPKTVGNVTLLR
jgi:PKD repeat protein